MTTLALGEEGGGPSVTTLAVGEEGGKPGIVGGGKPWIHSLHNSALFHKK